MSFLSKLTDHAHDVYKTMRTYRNSARQNPIREWTFLDYCPENGESFTVFKAQNNKRVK